MPKKHKIGLVLSGGGARGAYEAGIMHYILTQLAPKKLVIQNFDIYCGSSVGAINTCYLASMAHENPIAAGNKLYQIWNTLKQEQIYARDFMALSQFVAQSAAGITLNLFRRMGKNSASRKGQHFVGLFNTKPLPKFLRDYIDFKQLNKNVTKGPVSAVSLTATNVNTGYMELFVKKKRETAYTGAYVFRETELEVEHAVASGAIPIVFPAQKIGKYHYVDGGLRLNTPMSPAIQLGADRVFVIGMHNAAARRNLEGSELDKVHTPPLGEIIGKVLNSIFLDHIEYDIEQLTRINRIIEWGRMTYGEDFLERINDTLLKKKIRGDIANRGLKDIQAYSIFPSRDIGKLFSECLSDQTNAKAYFGPLEKLVLKILDIDINETQDFLSYLMFMPNYLQKLLGLGYLDAETHKDELIEFLSCE
jgi:NTE family protein